MRQIGGHRGAPSDGGLQREVGSEKGERQFKFLELRARVREGANAPENGGKLLLAALSLRICASGRCRPCIVVKIYNSFS